MIFTGFRTFTERTYSKAHEELWRAAPRYVNTEAYPDEEFAGLVRETAHLGGDTEDEVLRRFGEFAGADTFRLLYPDYYAAHEDTLSFLEQVEGQIHASVRRTIPGARPPHVTVRRVDDDNVMISYTSERHLCMLVEGLVEGVAGHYGDHVRVEHPLCMERGDGVCSFVVTRLL